MCLGELGAVGPRAVFREDSFERSARDGWIDSPHTQRTPCARTNHGRFKRPAWSSGCGVLSASTSHRVLNAGAPLASGQQAAMSCLLFVSGDVQGLLQELDVRDFSCLEMPVGWESPSCLSVLQSCAEVGVDTLNQQIAKISEGIRSLAQEQASDEQHVIQLRISKQSPAERCTAVTVATGSWHGDRSIRQTRRVLEGSSETRSRGSTFLDRR